MALPDDQPVFSVCFVCTGNICRSPMAEVVFRDLAERAGLAHLLSISSAGTGEWHVGEPADPRTLAALARSGRSGEAHRARQFDRAWFDRLDLVCTFDRGQQRILRDWAPDEQARSLVQPLLGFASEAPDPEAEVPDPYYGDDGLFDRVRDLVEDACRGLLEQLEPVILAASRERDRPAPPGPAAAGPPTPSGASS